MENGISINHPLRGEPCVVDGRGVDGLGTARRRGAPVPFVRFAERQGAHSGGKQFWGDQLHFRGWRIQRNATTGHFRLLDKDEYRSAWGSFKHCNDRLSQIKRRQQLTPFEGEAVIVLHGLGRTRDAMDKLCQYLERKGGLQVYNVSYPSTRQSIAAHAQDLARIIENLQRVHKIHFVGHSLGNLVVRHYLADQTDPQTGRRPDRRIGRIVMLGPPNNGARLAQIFGDNKVFKLIVGESGTQLGSAWEKLQARLATPTMPFGIIAGGRNNTDNPLMEGDDDLVVTVEETKLAGARDFVVLPVFHTFMMDDPMVQQCTLRFLETGSFVSEDRRQPIPAAEQTRHDSR